MRSVTDHHDINVLDRAPEHEVAQVAATTNARTPPRRRSSRSPQDGVQDVHARRHRLVIKD